MCVCVCVCVCVTGLHPLVPYLIKYTADELLASAPYTPALLLLLRLVRALLRNTDLRLDDYLHQLLPALLTCVVASGVGECDCIWHGSVSCASRRV